MKRAEITVFLSMVLILIVSFILGIMEITVIHISKNMNRLETDRAVFSLFGEYQKDLLEDYHVFSIDGTYETGDYSEDRLTGRLHYYGSANTDHEITGIQFLTAASIQEIPKKFFCNCLCYFFNLNRFGI